MNLNCFLLFNKYIIYLLFRLSQYENLDFARRNNLQKSVADNIIIQTLLLEYIGRYDKLIIHVHFYLYIFF